MRPLRSFLALVLGAALLAACSPSVTEDEAAAPTSTSPPTTAVTTTAPAATTTTDTPRRVHAAGRLTAPVVAVIGDLYSWLADRRSPEPAAPAALLAALADYDRPIADRIEVTGVVHQLAGGDSVAVVHVAEDIIFMVKDTGPWRIAGTSLAGEDPWLGDGPRLLLVLGSDARRGQNQRRLRADSIHIVGVDPARTAGSIVGFPRDSWVEGPSGMNKFTNIMAGKGPGVMMNTTETLTGLDLDGYVVTGFVGFEGLIEDLGGLTIDLPSPIRSGIEGWQNYPRGTQELGPTALLRLARIRKTLDGGDFARSANHGLIMLAGIAAVQQMGVDELPRLLDILLARAWTDLSTEDLLTMAATVYILDPDAMVNMVLPGRVGTAGDRSVVFLDDTAADIYRDLADGVIDEP